VQGAGTTEQTYYRWRREYGGLNVAQGKRLKQLEDENGRLKKLVADLSLEEQVLKDIAQGQRLLQLVHQPIFIEHVFRIAASQ
jgi:putative transposase